MSGNNGDRRDGGNNGDRRDERIYDVDEAGSVVSGPSTRQLSAWQKLGIGALVLVVFLAFIWIGQGNRNKRVSKVPEVALAPGGTFTPAPIVLPPALPLPSPGARPVTLQRGREMSPIDSPIFAFSGNSEHAEEKPPAAAEPTHRPVIQLPEPALPDGSLASKLQPTMLQGAKATLLPHPDMLLTEGTIIPCTLQTAINTELAGFVKCVLPNDVSSTTGNVVLLDRGTIVVGEVQHGLVEGEDRVFVLWDRAETPDHAIIQLSSPAVDELGRAGLPGQVNYHFWQRFGGAILLSVIQGSLQAATALASNVGSSSGGSGTYVNSFQSNSPQVTNTALQATINIPPTLEKNQGDDVAIFVARDLDFSSIYQLRVLQAGEQR